MKTLTLAILMSLALVSCSRSQIEGNTWSSLVYSHDSGPLPPQYHFDYNISINADGSAILDYRFGYEKGGKTLKYAFKLSEEDIQKLNGLLKESKIFDGTIKSLPENRHPIGGPLSKVQVIYVNPDPNLDQPPKLYESPYFPEKEYAEGLENLYTYIEKLIPPAALDEIKAKKEEKEKTQQD
ncbi:hypothetical protein D4R99_05050 [bacterium]|nr:MAG: hypothetical protein D4R99_05050 [bacterium]